MYKYINNPIDNQKINIHSKLGKIIIKEYLNFIIGGANVPTEAYTNNSHLSEYVFNQKSNNIKEIYGLIGLDYYKFDSPNGTTKRILLLSDKHVPLVEKIPLDSQESILYDEFIVYLIQTCSNLGRCVDFYLEMGLTTNQGRPLKGGMYRSSIQIPMINIDTLNTIRKIFEDCSGRIVNNSCAINELKGPSHFPVATETNVDNLRVHNIDLRLNFQNDRGVTSLMGPKSNAFKRAGIDFYEKFLQFILEIPGHPTRENIINLCLYDRNCDLQLIYKYIDKIELVKKKINKEQRKFNGNKILGIDIDVIRRYVYDFRRGAGDIYMPPTSTSLNASLIDIYTILRILKNFEIDSEQKRTRGPSKCKGIADQNNIIVFAGANHIKCYQHIFDKILPADSCKYSQERNTFRLEKKILEIDTTWGFKNFNELMTNFCEDLSNHSINFYKLNNNTIRMAVERYKNNPESCPLIETWVVTEVENMSELFKNYSNFNGNITNWNTINVKNMRSMFQDATNFNQPLNWNTNNVTDMSSMFQGAESFNQALDFTYTGNVKDMSGMFFNAKNFNQPLNFDTRNVNYMSQMFALAENFNQGLEWNTGNVTDMSYMFYYAKSFNQSLNFDTGNVKDMESIFENSSGRLSKDMTD